MENIHALHSYARATLSKMAAGRPGAARMAEYPLLSPETAFMFAFVVYPAVILGLQALVAGCTYDTNAWWLRYLGAVHNFILFVFSLCMWVGVAWVGVAESPWSSALEFFCLPEGEPAMTSRLALFTYLFYASKLCVASCRLQDSPLFGAVSCIAGDTWGSLGHQPMACIAPAAGCRGVWEE